MTTEARAERRRQLRANIAEIKRTLDIAHPPKSGHVYEIRALNVGRRTNTVSGYFKSTENAQAAELAAKLADREDCPGVYYTPNPVKAELYARAPGRLVEFAKETTSDAAVVRRIVILVDLDALREAGISSSDAEHQAALDRADACFDLLIGAGFDDRSIFTADSGNGGHLQVFVDLPNTTKPPNRADPMRDLVSRFLQALALDLDDEAVKVDLTCFNSARICKLYGTPARKGFDTPERPHRESSLRMVAPTIVPATLEQIEEFARRAPETEQRTRTRSSRSRETGPFDLAGWLERVGLRASMKGPKAWQGGELYQFTQCPFSTAHSKGAWVALQASGAVAAGCRHATCRGQGWPELKALFPDPERSHADFDYARNGQRPDWHDEDDAEGAEGAEESAERGRDNRRARAERPEWPEPEPLIPPLPDVIDFDNDLFPDSLSIWARDVAAKTGVPKAFVWVALMCALGSIIGRRLGLRPKRHDRNWIVVPNLWGVVIGRPGSVKSPPVESILGPLYALADKANDEYEAAMKLYLEELRAWEKDKSDDKGPAPVKPVHIRYVVNHFTIEKLGSILRDNPNGILIFRDELIGILRMFERKGYEYARAFLLESWNGNSPGSFDTINRGTISVPAMCISVVGTMSPGPLAKYLTDAFGDGAEDDGFAQRIFQLGVWPDPLPSGLGEDKVSPAGVYQTAKEVFRKLDELDPVEFGADPVNRIENPRAVPYIGFSDEAQEVFNDYLRDLDHKLHNLDEPDALASHFSKYRSLMPSLALIYHAVDFVGGWAKDKRVGIEYATKARRACKVLASHAKRIYSPLARRRPSERGADAVHRKLLRREIKTPIKPRDLQRAMPTVFETVEAVEAALSNLVKRGVVAPRPEPTGAKRGIQRTTVYDVNPKIFETNGPGRDPGQEG